MTSPVRYILVNGAGRLTEPIQLLSANCVEILALPSFFKSECVPERELASRMTDRRRRIFRNQQPSIIIHHSTEKRKSPRWDYMNKEAILLPERSFGLK